MKKDFYLIREESRPFQECGYDLMDVVSATSYEEVVKNYIEEEFIFGGKIEVLENTKEDFKFNVLRDRYIFDTFCLVTQDEYTECYQRLIEES